MSAKDRYKQDRFKPKWGGGPFHALPRDFASSQVLASMSPYACKLLLDVLAFYSGFNNGDLAITWRQMHPRGWKSKATLLNATNELLARRIIVRTRQGGRRACHLYALTIYQIDECKGKLDSHVTVTDKPSRAWMLDEPLKPIPVLQAEHRQRMAAGK